MHFRGIPVYAGPGPEGDTTVATWAWSAICNRLVAEPNVTTDPRLVRCNECRAVLKLPRVGEFQDESEKRYP